MADNEAPITVYSTTYSKFTYDWVSAMIWQAPGTSLAIDADLDNDNNVSFLEAYKYASSQNNGTQASWYSSNSNYLGYNHGLDGKLFDLPILSGSKNVKISESEVFNIINLPPSASVMWQYPSTLSNSASGLATKRLAAINTSITIPDIQVKAIVSVPVFGFTFPLEISGITYWKPGINMDTNGVLMSGFFTGDYGEVILASDFFDVNTYTWTADNGFIAANQGSYAVTFTLEPGYDTQVGETVNVIAEFMNPFGEMSYFIRNFVLE